MKFVTVVARLVARNCLGSAYHVLQTFILGAVDFKLCFLCLQYDSTVKVKCTAMLQTVYLKSNEITLEVERSSNRRRGGKGGDRGREAGGSAKSAKRDRLTSASSSGNGGLVPALESRDGEAMPSNGGMHI